MSTFTILIVSAQVGTFNKERALVGTLFRHSKILRNPIDTSIVVMYFSAPTLLSLSSAAGSEREMNFAILMTAFG